MRISEPGRAELETVELPAPGPGQARVRVTSCGLCGSDATIFAGRHPVIRPPLVPGHEIVGIVEAIGDAGAAPDALAPGADDLLGRRVAVLPLIGCGHCAQCRRDQPRLCAEMRLIGGQIDGGAAGAVLLPISALVPIPDDVPAEVAPIVEPLAVARHAVARAPGLVGAEVLVVGGGPIGLLVALAARAAGAGSVTLVEPVAARQGIVAHVGIPVVAAVPAAQHDVVFDCVGGTELPPTLLASVLAGGALVLVGVSGPQLVLDGILLQRQERAVLGSHMYTRTDMEAALRLLADGLLPTDADSLALLFDRRPLTDAVAAFDDLVERRSASLKILLEP